MNNSNFGYGYRNNLDNCKFAPIFDEYRELTFISRYHGLFYSKVRQFITSDLLKKDIEENLMINYPNQIQKIDFMKSNCKQLKMKYCNKLKQQKNQKNETKKNKKRTKLVDFVDRRDEALTNQKIKSQTDFDEEYSCSIRLIAIEKTDF